ncbi:MAG: AAA family ATPase [Desulfobacteraceae bacterium]|nr:MAG: AAA family ATPase [Desulfobacteraceae bacterium]
MSKNIISVQLSIRNSEVKSGLEKILRSAEGFEVLKTPHPQLVDLLIIETEQKFEKDIDQIKSFLDSRRVNEVFITSADVNPDLLLKAMRIGIKEFFPQPLNEQEVKRALKDFQQRRVSRPEPEPSKSGRIINIMGSKGGVGTTTIAVNLAAGLAEMPERYAIALVDMNTLFGEIPLFLNLNPKYHWGEITRHIERLDPTFLMKILTRHSSGIQILPSPSSLNGQQPATPEVVSRLLGLMKRMFDFVIVDGGQILNDNTLKVFEMSERMLLVSLLNLPCLRNAFNILQSLSNYGYHTSEYVNIIINRYIKRSEITIEDAEKSLKNKIFCILPNDFKTTIDAINQGKTLFEIASKSATTASMRHLAYAVANDEESSQKKKRWRLFSR